MKKLLPASIILFLGGCTAYLSPPLILGEKDDYIWVGRHDSNDYMLSIRSVRDDIWFQGMITRNVTDTVFIRGFEKGNHYITHLRTEQADSSHRSDIGSISIWVKGPRADTIHIRNTRDSIAFLPLEMYMIKSPKSK